VSEVITEPRDAPVPDRAELVVVGAGVMGLAIAYNLCKRGLTDGVRQQWSTEMNVRLMQESVALCRSFAKELKVNVWFRQGGYLFIARTPEQLARLERNHEMQRRLGLDVRMLDGEETRGIVPQLDARLVLGAAYNSSDGILFPWPFVWGYAQGATHLGARLFTHTPVVGIDREDGGFAVHTPRGTVRAARVVNACGAWSPNVARMVGVDLPTYPVRHEICASEPLKPFLGPMVSDLSTGLYCSQSMRGEIIGGISLTGDAPTIAMGARLKFMATYARELTRLMPVLGDIKVIRQWAGPYDMTGDGNPILGEPPKVPGFFLCSGFGGHGFMMAPTMGVHYANWLTGGERHEIFDRCPLSRFEGDGPIEKEDFVIG